MESSDYLRALKRSWVIIVLAVIAGALGGYWIYGSKTPTYQSSVQMVVGGNGGSTAEGMSSWVLGSELALQLSQAANTAPALEAAKKAAGYPDAAVTATSTASGQTPFVTVNVVGQSPTVAKAIADHFATRFRSRWLAWRDLRRST